MKILIIYDSKIETGVNPENIYSLIKESSYFPSEILIEFVCMSNLKHCDLSDITLLINTLGKYYREDKFHLISDYYNNGGIILNIGCKPFTIPYTVNEQITFHPETVNAIRTLTGIDYWVETGAITNSYSIKILNNRYSFLNKIKFPELIETCSPYYSLSGSYNAENSEESWETDAQFETACGFCNSANRMTAAPISRLDHFAKGSMIFLNFTPKDKKFYSTKNGNVLLSEIIKTTLTDTINCELTSQYAIYYTNELQNLNIKLKKLKTENLENQYSYKITISNISSKKNVPATEFIESFVFQEDNYIKNYKIEMQEEGLYKVSLQVFQHEKLIAEKITGFYIYSEKSIKKLSRKVSPISLDLTKSTDFLIQNGKPFAMHGTTYFVTDNYQECFVNFNSYQCYMDLTELKEAGFNILRSGNWKLFLEFFDEKGNIREKSLRALTAYFITAALNDFPVQYVPGSTVFNNWDRTKCPIHNPEMKNKVLNAFRHFTETFKNWTNIQIDIINEPSYSWIGKWTTGRPSEDEYEKQNWIKWLKKKYNNNLSALRLTWNVSSDRIRNFEDANLPSKEQFSRIYYRTEKHIEFPLLVDFYAFARESFSNWVADISNAVKTIAPNMTIMMGRDETLRIPSQQDEVYNKNIDFINWHQWSQNSIVFLEYYLNKVREIPCCGQELGVYQYENPRGIKRFSPEGYKNILERKLLYSLGNWIQWQSFNNPYKKELSENSLGLIRADRTETPYMEITRQLSWLEERTSNLMLNRDEDTTDILTLHPTNNYFSVDNSIALQGIRTCIIAQHYHLKLQSNMILEHLFNRKNKSQIGNPKLIILPCVQMLSDNAWNEILYFVQNGTNVLISGNINTDIYWNHVDRLSQINVKQVTTEPINVTEKIKIGNKNIEASFRKITGYCDPAHSIDKNQYNITKTASVHIHQIGKGKLIHCPIPLELADSIEPVCELYKFASKECSISNNICEFKSIKNKSNFFVYPISYKACTVYTIVNEGNADSIEFTDKTSGVSIKIFVDNQRASKIYIDKTGQLIGAYIHNKLIVGNDIIKPNKAIAIYRKNKETEFTYM